MPCWLHRSSFVGSLALGLGVLYLAVGCCLTDGRITATPWADRPVVDPGASVSHPVGASAASGPRLDLEFLGTGASWTIPRLGCSCATCKAARGSSPRSRRLRSSLKVGTDPYLLVDMGPDVYQQLDRQPKARPDAVLLTHAHPDHASGASELDPIARKSPIPLFTTPPIFAQMSQNMPWTVPLFSFEDVSRPRRAGPYTISSFALTHGTNTVGFRIERGGRALAYVCDVDEVPQPSLRSLMGLDLMILDGTNIGLLPPAAPEPLHIKPDGIDRLLRATRPRRVVFTHVGHMAQPHEAVAERCRKAYGAEVAHDGWRLTL
ncbi:MAG: MBL fold metallo-hydrolase [Candidatus Riflebacteria bacterium]|nr:MBL fold metallo-hydrolase [Candidatus Riflebacteria bacterium]